MNPHTKTVCAFVASHYGMTVPEMLSRDRHKSVAEARQIAMWICRERFGMSFIELGREFARDHTTVMAGVQRIAAAQGLTLRNRGLLWSCVVRATPQFDEPQTMAAAAAE